MEIKRCDTSVLVLVVSMIFECFLCPCCVANLTSVDLATKSGDVLDTTSVFPGESKCFLSSADPFLHNTIQRLLKIDKVSLIEYQLLFPNYTVSPLGKNSILAYKLDKWSRVTTSQGQTLLSLAFNYGVLSMATLTLGTHTLDVDLIDHPAGCMGMATEEEQIASIIHLLVRDFQNTPMPTLIDEERVCHEMIMSDDGYAVFRDKCYFQNQNTKEIIEDENADNFWLTILYVLLFIVRYALFFFGPYLFITSVERMCTEQIPYVVKLKDTLVKTIFITTPTCPMLFDGGKEVNCKRSIDLSNRKGFPKLKYSVGHYQVPIGKPVKVTFSQYDITVNYRRLLTENIVRVGLFESMYDAIFGCNIRTVGPFVACCYTNMFHGCCCCSNRKLAWIKFWRKVAKASMIFLIPIPYYIRLIIYYLCEHEEITLRKNFIERAGLRERYETTSSLIHYLTPTHPFFIAIYIVYALSAVMLAVMPKKKREGRLLKIIVGSFRDLKTLSWTETLSMVVSNVIWPFKRFGMFGCLVGIVYWPIALPITLIIATAYVVPTIYLTLRMAFYSRSAIFERMRRRKKNKPYQVNTKIDKDMHKFEVESFLEKESKESTVVDGLNQNEIALDGIDSFQPKEHFRTLKDNISLASSIIRYQTTSCRRLATYVLTAVLCVATLYGVMIILSEVIGCLVEIVVFTVMGIIVNASALLKYVMLVLMIFVYCCDCFNNMGKKYLKLNKALFSEVKGRIKNISEVTSLPSFLQENHGFKAQELKEQAEYESPDDIAEKPLNHWMINDLVLFVDSEDMPRIPKQLFDEVCQIRVAGVPGPVFRGLIEAMQQLLKIIVFIGFVFIVVLTFGSVYKVSTTNQMLATLVGGFLPMVLKTFMAPPAPDVELGTVSFKNKLDEVIKNFCQYWPIYDLPFTPVSEEEEAKKMDDKTPVTKPPEAAIMDAAAAAEPVDFSTETHAEGILGQAALGMSTMDSVHAPLLPAMSLSVGPLESNNNGIAPRSDEVRQTESGKTGTSGFGENDEKLRMTRFAELPPKDDSIPEVDFVICMPDKYDDVWLDEWSDISSIRQ